jgi:hypothetical protein
VALLQATAVTLRNVGMLHCAHIMRMLLPPFQPPATHLQEKFEEAAPEYTAAIELLSSLEGGLAARRRRAAEVDFKRANALQLSDKPGEALSAIRSAKAHLQVGIPYQTMSEVSPVACVDLHCSSCVCHPQRRGAPAGTEACQCVLKGQLQRCATLFV